MTTFSPATEAQWLKKVEGVLKGADFTEKLVSTMADGVIRQPLYAPVTGAPRAVRPLHGPWEIFARMDAPAPAAANAQARDDIGNGVNGVVLVMADAATARGAGLALTDLTAALHGLPLHATSLRLEGSSAAAVALARHIDKQPLDPARLAVHFGLTEAGPVAALMKQGFAGPFMVADGRAAHEQGLTAAEELGVALAEGVCHLRSLENLGDDDLARAVSMVLAADQDMFLTLAKFRAARLLWARVLEAAKLPAAALALHGETSWRMMATLDPHTNILRATAAVFGAGLGGASSFTVLPFSQAQGLPNSFARRVARNVQNVLLEESELWRVDDPAAGAGVIEDLTAQLCEKAWGVFQAAERGTRPKPRPDAATSLPTVGTTAYRLKDEYKPEVEA